MRKIFVPLLASTLFLTACGVVRDTNLNPFNWFGRSQSETLVDEKAHTNPLLPKRKGIFASLRERNAEYNGTPFDQVTGLKIERIPGGAIIRATGLAARQGIYEVRLTPATEDETPVDGVLTYRLEGLRPGYATPVGTKPTREVVAARKITDQTLKGVRSIRVEGLRNAQVSRR